MRFQDTIVGHVFGVSDALLHSRSLGRSLKAHHGSTRN